MENPKPNEYDFFDKDTGVGMKFQDFGEDQNIDGYKFVEKIGEGAFAWVGKYKDTKINRFVAVKVLKPHPDRYESREDEIQFQNEVDEITALSSNSFNIVHPIDKNYFYVNKFDYKREYSCLIMEFCAGGSLEEKIKTQELKGKTKQVIKLGMQLSEAVQTAHEYKDVTTKPRIHQDINPRNILFDDNGNVKLADFAAIREQAAIEKSLNWSRRHREHRKPDGIPDYMPLEQIKGKPTTKSDIFSIGCVLFEAFTGKPPFDQTKYDEIWDLCATAIKEDDFKYYKDAERIWNELEITKIPSTKARLEQIFISIIKKCLVKNPDNRYQSARKLKDDLENLNLSGGSYDYSDIISKFDKQLDKILPPPIENPKPSDYDFFDKNTGIGIKFQDFGGNGIVWDRKYGYEFVEKIGEGAFGWVGKYKDREFKNRFVAVKVLKSPPRQHDIQEEEEAELEAEILKFQNEGDELDTLANCPYIVTPHRNNVFYVNKLLPHKKYSCLIMEFCAGGSLEQKMKTQELKGKTEKVIKLGKQLSEAVQTAHEYKDITTKALKPRIHQDIKPRNILFDDNENVKLADFGAIREQEEIEKSLNWSRRDRKIRKPEGTPGYMPLEQMKGEPTTKSDIFSVGYVLFEAFTGKPPFNRAKYDEIWDLCATAIKENDFKYYKDAERIWNELEITKIPSRNSDIEQTFISIIKKCLAKNPDNRYQSARKLKDDLETLNESQQAGKRVDQKQLRREPVPAEADFYQENLLNLYEDVATEWHYKFNDSLHPEDFLPNAPVHVWWLCKKGEHSWSSTIQKAVIDWDSWYKANKKAIEKGLIDYSDYSGCLECRGTKAPLQETILPNNDKLMKELKEERKKYGETMTNKEIKKWISKYQKKSVE